MRTSPWLAAALLALPAGARAAEPEVSFSVHGNVAQAVVQDEAGKPVAGYPVGIRGPGRKVIAEGQTGADGKWEHYLPQKGKYEVFWGPAQKGGHDIEVHYDAPPTTLRPCCLTGLQGAGRAVPPKMPWLLGAVGGGFLMLVGTSSLMLWVSRRTGRADPAAAPEAPPPELRYQPLIVVVLLAAGVGLLAWAVSQPGSADRPQAAAPPATNPAAIVVEKGELKELALADLRRQNVQPLSGALSQLLANEGTDWNRIKSQDHKLLAEDAPDFELRDYHGKVRRLSDFTKKGPVVLVFYYGYFCDHCVSQLFALQNDIRYFHELGAEVVAVSPDPPETTRERYREYGAFSFPVLSDPDNKVAREFGTYFPPEGKESYRQYHGTFVIDRDGKVQWANRDTKPFTHNRTLLYKLAELEDKLPRKGE